MKLTSNRKLVDLHVHSNISDGTLSEIGISTSSSDPVSILALLRVRIAGILLSLKSELSLRTQPRVIRRLSTLLFKYVAEVEIFLNPLSR